MTQAHALLGDQALAELRAQYDGEMILRMALANLESTDPRTAPYTTFVGDEVYRSPRMRPIDRERCLIAILVQSAQAMPLAMHVYWGLMEGLSTDDVLQTVLLAGMYGGLRCHTSSEMIVRECFLLLNELGEKGGEAAGTAAVANALLARFLR
jgi:hypothetical protein